MAERPMFDPLGIFRALEEDFNRLSGGLESGATAVQEASEALGQQIRELHALLAPGSSQNPARRGRPPTIDRTEVVRLHGQGLPVREIAAQLGASDVRVSQILREEGLQPRFAPRAEPTARELGAEQRRQDILRLHGQGLTPSAIAAELQGLAEDAGTYVASLPEFPREEMEKERWRAGFVRHRALRAIEDLGVYRSCQVAMQDAETSALPRLAVQAQQCIDRAMRLLRECCPPPPRPSPLLEPVLT